MAEETLDLAITGASAIVIDSTSTDEQRAKAISDFAEEIANMSGERIVAPPLTVPKPEKSQRRRRLCGGSRGDACRCGCNRFSA